jgi:hypothetical protein
MNGERGSFFGMERTEAGEILAGLAEREVFADYANDVRLLLDAIRE